MSEQENCGAQIPLEWVALFNAADVYFYDASEEEEEQDISSYLSFVTSTDLAAENLERRMPSLRNLLSTERGEYCEKLQKQFLASNQQYIHLDIIGVMATTGESMEYEGKQWASTLAGMDEEVAEIRSGISRLFRGSGVPPAWKAAQGWSP